MTVGLVIVSHSDRLARGVVELAGQMAPDVAVGPTGGGSDGNLGTDFEAVNTAVDQVDDGAGAVLLYDLGSARMVAELVVETREPRAVLVDAPVVEGAVAAAVSAQGGSALAEVAQAARSAAHERADESATTATTASAVSPPQAAAEQPLERDLALRNEVGLHARPAALLARCLAGLQAEVHVALGQQQANAGSVLEVMGLGARKGDTVRLRGEGPDAQLALDRIAELAERDFDE
ncbi:dihydroxyacetone kinase phosphoryl donor subunit DhaM [Bounagaea algeriensis]